MDNQWERELAQLQAQLKESLAAERFFETESGRLIVEIINKEVNILLKKITSDMFEKDHSGYVNALANLRANQGLLKKLQVAASPIRRAKIQEKLDNGQ